jgi:competence protein ComEA
MVPSRNISAHRVHRRWVECVLLVAVLGLAIARILPSGDVRADDGRPAAANLVHRVDLNRAAWYELADLPGIGEAKARTIVEDREARGPFSALEDLDRVPGIGPATVARIRNLVIGGS